MSMKQVKLSETCLQETYGLRSVLVNTCVMLYRHCFRKHWDRGFETRSRHGYMYAILFYVVLHCVGRGLAMGRSPIQGVLPKRPNGFVVSEVNSELERTTG
jgi:hypothetical protein